ncbi:14992_t:CDS:2, partial [Acaulospora morrowiae]
NADKYKCGNTEGVKANNKKGTKNNDIVETKGEPKVDLQDNEDEVVMVPTGDIITTSSDDLGDPSNQKNKRKTRGRHPDYENRVVMVSNSDIMTVNCDDSGGPSKKTNCELASNNHVKNSKGETKNNNLVKIRGLRTDFQFNKNEVMRVLTTNTMIVSCDDSGESCRRENQELVIGDKRYCDTNGLTDRKPDASEGGLGCHKDEKMIIDDPSDKGKTENEMKGETVIINARKL